MRSIILRANLAAYFVHYLSDRDEKEWTDRDKEGRDL